jgi:hypothetical protein
MNNSHLFVLVERNRFFGFIKSECAAAFPYPRNKKSPEGLE